MTIDAMVGVGMSRILEQQGEGMLLTQSRPKASMDTGLGFLDKAENPPRGGKRFFPNLRDLGQSGEGSSLASTEIEAKRDPGFRGIFF